MKQLFLTIVFGLIFQIGFSQKVIEKNFRSIFEKYGVDGCFVLYNQVCNEFIADDANFAGYYFDAPVYGSYLIINNPRVSHF